MPKYQSKPSTLIIILKSYPIPSPGPKPQNPDPYIPNPTAPQDNMNAMLEGVTVTGRDGKVTNLEQVYLRGSQIRYFILPDMLRHAPMFKKKGRGAGRGVYGPGKGRGKGLAARARTAAAATRK